MTATGIHRSADLEAWLEYRRKHLTSTDVPAIMGLSPYSTPLGVWLSKTGRRESDEQVNRDALEWGTRLEPMALDWIRDELKLPKYGIIHSDEIIGHHDYPWLCCTPDGFSNGQVPAFAVEVKAPGAYMADEWKNQIPDHARLQARIAAACLGMDRAIVAGIIQPRIYWMWVDTDLPTLDPIIAECERFWVEHVLADEPPEVTSDPREAGFVRELHPDDSGAIISLSPLAVEASRRLEWLAEQIKPMKVETDLLKNQIKMDMGSASYGTLPSGNEGAWSWTTGSRGRILRRTKRVPNMKDNPDA